MKYVYDNRFGNVDSRENFPKFNGDVGTFERKRISEYRRVYLEILNNLKDEDHKIDDEIVSLYTRKMAILNEAIKRAGDLTSFPSITGVSLNELRTEYERRGFKSKTVKNCVAKIRMLFFDDTNEKYREFHCTNIEFSDGYGYEAEDSFEFTNQRNHNVFFITIADRMKLTLSDKLKYHTDYFWETFCIRTKRGRMEDIVMSTFSLDDVRSTIEKIVNAEDYSQLEKYDFKKNYISLEERIENVEKQFTLNHPTHGTY